MWDCVLCGCRAIAHDLGFCPQCFEDRKEDDVPKTTVEGGGSGPETVPEAPEEPKAPEAAPPAPKKAKTESADAGRGSDSFSVDKKESSGA